MPEEAVILTADLKLQRPTTAERQIRDIERNLFKGTGRTAEPLGRLTGKVSEFDKSLEAANARVIAFGASASVIAGITTAMQAMVTQTIKVEKTLLDINVLLGQSSSGLEKFSDSLFDVAKKTGQSFFDVAEAAKEFSRQGLGVQETLARTSDAMILARLTGLDFTKSVEQLTASVNQFSKEALTTADVVNTLANVDAKFAVSAKDLSEGLSRAGSVAQDAGASFNELIALITAVQQRTARGGAVIANGLKTIFTRVQRSDTLDSLEELGIGVRDVQGNTLPVIQILGELSKKYDTLSSAQKAFTSELVGGGYQINIVKSLFDDLGRPVSEYSKALKVANQSTDEAYQRNELLNKSLASLANEAGQNLTKLAVTFGSLTFEPALKRVFSLINGLGSGEGGQFKEVGAKIGTGILSGIGEFIGGPGLVYLLALAGKLLTKFGKFAKDSIGEVLSLGTPNAKILDTQKGIVDLLRSDIEARKIIESTVTSQIQKEQQLVALIKERVALDASSKNAQIGLARSLVSQGVVYKPSTGTFKTKAGGHMPLPISSIPREAIANEVAGAKQAGYQISPQNVRAMRATIDGKQTTVVYNNKEKVIHDFMGSGEPAIIPPTGRIANYPDGKGLLPTKTGKLDLSPYPQASSANQLLYKFLTETIGISTKKLPTIDYTGARRGNFGQYVPGSNKIGVNVKNIEDYYGAKTPFAGFKIGQNTLHEGFHLGYDKNRKRALQFVEENSELLLLPRDTRTAMRFLENHYGEEVANKRYKKFAKEEVLAVQFPSIFGFHHSSQAGGRIPQIRNYSGGTPKTIYRGVNSKYGDKNRGAGSLGIANKLVATIGQGNYSDNKKIGGLFGDKVLSKSLSGIKPEEVLNLSSYSDVVGLYKKYEAQLPQGLASKIKNSSGAEQLNYIQQAGASLTDILKTQGVKLISAPFAGGDAGVIGSRGLSGRMYIPLAGGYLNSGNGMFNGSKILKQGGFVKGSNKPTLSGLGEILSSIGIKGNFQTASGIESALKAKSARKKLFEYLKSRPIEVSSFPDRYFEISDGNHRKSLADLAGIKNIPAIINAAGGSLDLSKLYLSKRPVTLKEKLAEKYAQAKGVAQKVAIKATPYADKADDAIQFVRTVLGFSGGYMNAAIGFNLEASNAKQLKEIASLYGIPFDPKDPADRLRKKIRASDQWKRINRQEYKAEVRAGRVPVAAQEAGSQRTTDGFRRISIGSASSPSSLFYEPPMAQPLSQEQKALQKKLEALQIQKGSFEKNKNKLLKKAYQRAVQSGVDPSTTLRNTNYQTTRGFIAQSRLFQDSGASGGVGSQSALGLTSQQQAIKKRVEAPYAGSDPYAYSPAFLARSMGGSPLRGEAAQERLSKAQPRGVSRLFNFTEVQRRGLAPARRVVNERLNQRFTSGAFSASFAAPLIGGLAAEAFGGNDVTDQRVKRGISGSFGAIGAGAAIGATFGGPVGAIIGGIVGVGGVLKSVFDNLTLSSEDLTERIKKESEEREKTTSSIANYATTLEALSSSNLKGAQREALLRKNQQELGNLSPELQKELLGAGSDFKKIEEIIAKVNQEGISRQTAKEVSNNLALVREGKLRADSVSSKSTLSSLFAGGKGVKEIDQAAFQTALESLRKINRASKETELKDTGTYAFGASTKSALRPTAAASEAKEQFTPAFGAFLKAVNFEESEIPFVLEQFSKSKDEVKRKIIDLIDGGAENLKKVLEAADKLSEEEQKSRAAINKQLLGIRRAAGRESLAAERRFQLEDIMAQGRQETNDIARNFAFSRIESNLSQNQSFRSFPTNIRLQSELEVLKKRKETDDSIAEIQRGATRRTEEVLKSLKDSLKEIDVNNILSGDDNRQSAVGLIEGIVSASSPEQAIAEFENLKYLVYLERGDEEAQKLLSSLIDVVDKSESSLESIKNNTAEQKRNAENSFRLFEKTQREASAIKIQQKAFETTMRTFDPERISREGIDFSGIARAAQNRVKEGIPFANRYTDPTKLALQEIRGTVTPEKRAMLLDKLSSEEDQKALARIQAVRDEVSSGALYSPEEIAKKRQEAGLGTPEERAKAVYEKYSKIKLGQSAEKSQIDEYNTSAQREYESKIKQRQSKIQEIEKNALALEKINSEAQQAGDASLESFQEVFRLRSSAQDMSPSEREKIDSAQLTYKATLDKADIAVETRKKFTKSLGYAKDAIISPDEYRKNAMAKLPELPSKPTLLEYKPQPLKNINLIDLEARAAMNYNDQFTPIEQLRSQKLSQLTSDFTRISARSVVGQAGAEISPFLSAFSSGSYSNGRFAPSATAQPEIEALIKSGQFSQVKSRLQNIYPRVNAAGQREISQLLPKLDIYQQNLNSSRERGESKAKEILGEGKKEQELKVSKDTLEAMEKSIKDGVKGGASEAKLNTEGKSTQLTVNINGLPTSDGPNAPSDTTKRRIEGIIEFMSSKFGYSEPPQAVA